jgi:hypothetical protein
MPLEPPPRQIFSFFQNLNLLVLMEDLRSGRAAKGAWLSGGDLCPIAHALPSAKYVREVIILGQAGTLHHGCEHAARHVGADPHDLVHFLHWWDQEPDSSPLLLQQLQGLWHERLADADAIQRILRGIAPFTNK